MILVFVLQSIIYAVQFQRGMEDDERDQLERRILRV